MGTKDEAAILESWIPAFAGMTEQTKPHPGLRRYDELEK